MCKAKLFFQQCCICLFNSPLPYEFYCIRLFYLLQTAVQLQNDLSVLYLFLRQNCFFAVLFFSIRHCFLLILSLLLRYSVTSNSSELIQQCDWDSEFLNLGPESWEKFEFTQAIQKQLVQKELLFHLPRVMLISFCHCMWFINLFINMIVELFREMYF